jgi:hypothetical protein
MIKNDNEQYDTYQSLDGWLFWYDIDDNLWKCVERDEFIEALKNPDYKTSVLIATSMSELILYISKTNDDIN